MQSVEKDLNRFYLKPKETPLKKRDAVNTATESEASAPLIACTAIKTPGTSSATAVKIFLVAVVDKRLERRSRSASQLERIAIAYLPEKEHALKVEVKALGMNQVKPALYDMN
nr:unnamed protein product [Callosobruchus chinensis]